jgi:hypothetical protein
MVKTRPINSRQSIKDLLKQPHFYELEIEFVNKKSGISNEHIVQELLRITTVSGDLRVREARGEVDLHTTSGDVSVSGERIARFAAESMSGDIQFDGLLTTDAPWREVPREYGAAGTVARHFRRLTHACVWERLLQALHDAEATHPLQALRRVIFRAARRAYRIRGLRILVLARRLKLLEALPGPSWLLPDPDLSKRLIAWQLRHSENFPRFVRTWGKTLRKLMGLAGGRMHIPRAIRLAMP